MFWTGSISGDEWQVNVSLGHAGQFDFRFFSSLFQSLHSHLIAGKVDTVFFLEFFNKVVDQSLVEVIAAQSVVTSSCQNFLYTVAHLDDGYIESTAAEVVYHDLLISFFINAVSQSSCGRLVDDTFYIQTSNLTSIFGCLTLCIGEVCRNGDNSFCYRLAQICFCVSFQFLQNHCRDLLWCIGFAVDGYFVVSTHFTFDRADGSVSVCNCLTFCNLTDHSFACFGESNNGWGCTSTFWISDYDWFAAFHNGYAGVCCT